MRGRLGQLDGKAPASSFPAWRSLVTRRIGVFICDCKGLISDHVDNDRLANEARVLRDVAMVERVELLCREENLNAALQSGLPG